MNQLIEFDIPEKPLNMNDGDQGKQKRDYIRRKQVWKKAAYFATCAAFPSEGPSGRKMGPCDVYVSIPVAGDIRRDPHNWYPTIKAIVDMIVEAGVWPDDTPDWVTTHEPQLRLVPKEDLWKEKVYVRLVEKTEPSSTTS